MADMDKMLAKAEAYDYKKQMLAQISNIVGALSGAQCADDIDDEIPIRALPASKVESVTRFSMSRSLFYYGK